MKMLSKRLANDIRNQLQAHIRLINWGQFNEINVYSSVNGVKVIIGNNEYTVRAIRSYDTIVGFAYDGILYEIGKYSRKTSKQFTKIYNYVFTKYKRVYYDRYGD